MKWNTRTRSYIIVLKELFIELIPYGLFEIHHFQQNVFSKKSTKSSIVNLQFKRHFFISLFVPMKIMQTKIKRVRILEANAIQFFPYDFREQCKLVLCLTLQKNKST